MTYPVFNATANSTFVDLFVYSNGIVNGIMSYGILFIIFSVLFFGTKRYGAKNSHSLLICMVVCSFVSATLAFMGALPERVLLFFVLGTILMYIYTYHD